MPKKKEDNNRKKAAANSGQFQKGHPKMGGRKAGTKNKVTNDLRKLIQEQLAPRIQKLGEEIDKIADPADKVSAMAHWANYILPKYSNTTINADTHRDISTEEYLRQLNGHYQKKDIDIDITQIKIHNNR